MFIILIERTIFVGNVSIYNFWAYLIYLILYVLFIYLLMIVYAILYENECTELFLTLILWFWHLNGE